MSFVLSRAFACGLVLACLCGCVRATYTEGVAVNWDRAAAITPGVSTRGEVLALLGPPQNFASPTALAEFLESRGLDPSEYHRYPFSDVFAYQLSRARARGLMLVLYNRVDVHMDAEVLLIFFDLDGRVSDVARRELAPDPE